MDYTIQNSALQIKNKGKTITQNPSGVCLSLSFSNISAALYECTYFSWSEALKPTNCTGASGVAVISIAHTDA